MNIRLGCVCCPLQGQRKLQKDFEEHPKFVREYIKRGIRWWNKDREKEISSKKNFGTIYDLFYHNVFCRSYQNYLEKKQTIFGEMDCKEFLEEYFKIKLP